MKTLTFQVTLQVEKLDVINVQFLEDQLGNSILSSEKMDLGPQDEMGTTAKLLQVTED